jgi:hypothetical protein
MGKMIEVEIIECGKFFMKGKILNQDQVLELKSEVSIAKNLINLEEASSNDCCGGSCSCEHEDETEEEKTIVQSNKYFGSKFAYYALLGLSLAYLTTFTWKFFIRNK